MKVKGRGEGKGKCWIQLVRINWQILELTRSSIHSVSHLRRPSVSASHLTELRASQQLDVIYFWVRLQVTASCGGCCGTCLLGPACTVWVGWLTAQLQLAGYRVLQQTLEYSRTSTANLTRKLTRSMPGSGLGRGRGRWYDGFTLETFFWFKMLSIKYSLVDW